MSITRFVVVVSLLLLSACSGTEEFLFVPGSYAPDSSTRYGVRWSVTDVDDLGSRCFGACDKVAQIGIGSTDGFSDFDALYPWCDIERVELDGDIFVRIPRFGVERYVEDGYEYRVISDDAPTHPLFIEDGLELDEVYIGAFEACVEDSLLYSRPDVYPASNFTPQEFLAMSRARGNNYSIYDMRACDALFTLFAVEYGCRNSGVILGYGVAQYLQPLELESAGTNTFYSTVTSSATNDFTARYRGDKRKISVGSNIVICRGTQDEVVTIATVTAISDSKKRNQTIYSFDGPAISVDTDCFIGSYGATTNWCETCSAPLNWHTGRANMKDGYDPKQRNPMRYRWVENIVGSLWAYLPDVTFKDDKMFVCSNMRDYEMHCTSGAYEPVDFEFPFNDDNGVQVDKSRNNFWVVSLLCDSTQTAMSFGEQFSNTILSNQAFGAYYYRRDGTNIIANGGGFDHEFRCNMLTNRAWIYPDKKWFLYGARLIKK